MPRLIDADALMEHVDIHCGDCGEARHCITSAPTIDPVKHGRWEEYDGEDKGFHHCSECGRQAFNFEGYGGREVLSNYCPSCGAKMDGDAHE